MKGGDRSTTISIELTDEARAVPYTVTNTTYGVTSTAFIQVPAYGVVPRRRSARRPPNCASTPARPSHQHRRLRARGSGQDRVRGKRRLRERHEGRGRRPVRRRPDAAVHRPRGLRRPASITFTAVDGREGDAKIINSAVITLPINRRGPRGTAAHVLLVGHRRGGGEAATVIDLTSLTHTPEGLYADETAYTYSGGTDPRPSPHPSRGTDG